MSNSVSHVVSELEKVIPPSQVIYDQEYITRYSKDATFQSSLPDVVVLPRSVTEISSILKIANQISCPVIVRGGGTGLAGGAIPLSGGIVMSMEQMNHIVSIDATTSTATLEAGVTNGSLQAEAQKLGLFYPPDPASLSSCSIGGNVACNAGGPHCLKYGVTRDYVVGLTVVLADGQVLRLGGNYLKNATGYQLAQLFIGSEGTLAVIAGVTVKLIPLPPCHVVIAALFPTLDAAGRAVTAILGDGLLPSAIELMDSKTVGALHGMEEFSDSTVLPSDAGMLLIEEDGYKEFETHAKASRLETLCRQLGAFDVKVATTDGERAKLWAMRRKASEALYQIQPNKLGEDIVVPRNHIPEMIRRIHHIADTFGVQIAVFGHAGDGNLHPNILFDKSKPDEMRRVELAAEAIFMSALELGGTLSGEHGIGTLKRQFLADAVGDGAVAIMLKIKQLFDPKGILNPGKIFPPTHSAQKQGFLTNLPTLDNLTPG